MTRRPPFASGWTGWDSSCGGAKRWARMGDWLEVAPPGAGSRLVIYPKAMMPDWAERKPSIVFECADCQAAHARLRDAGVEFSSEPQPMAWGTFAIFRDADGNEFGLKGP